MKNNNLIQILLGGCLALQVCAQPVPQPTNLMFGSDFSVVGSALNKVVARSTAGNFTASGYASSPLDGSSAFGAQTIAYGLGTFTGSGSLHIEAGDLPPEIASGETDVFIYFQTSNMFHYQFVSSLSTSGQFHGYVIFSDLGNPGGISFSNSGGTVTASGTIGPGWYWLQAIMAGNRGPGSGIWSYSLSLTPADIPGRFTAGQKAGFYAQVLTLVTLGNQLLNVVANNTSSGAVKAVNLGLVSAIASLNSLVNQYSQLYLDPLDTNYTVLPQAVAPAVTPLAAGGGITQLESDDYNAWLTNLSQSVGYNTALTTAINRAQGAAYAGNSYWEAAQMTAAVQFEAQVAGLLDQEPPLRAAVVAQFESDGFTSIMVSTNDAFALQKEIATNGLPATLLDALTELGADPRTITNIQNALLTQDPAAMAGSFPQSLTDTNLDSAAHALAAGLRDASLMLINTSLLPGSQFRFDLPTVPGYTYTIQFSENLADRAAWTTLLATNATTPLLSFTNTPAAGAQAGFYRASHN